VPHLKRPCFFIPDAGQENREFFLCEYQVAALATDTHKQTGSKN
jgi:hypothetical protein